MGYYFDEEDVAALNHYADEVKIVRELLNQAVGKRTRANKYLNKAEAAFELWASSIKVGPRNHADDRQFGGIWAKAMMADDMFYNESAEMRFILKGFRGAIDEIEKYLFALRCSQREEMEHRW